MDLALGLHRAPGMKSIAALSLCGMLATTGCLDTARDVSEASQTSEADEVSSFKEMVALYSDDRNLLANGVRVRNHTGLAATVSSTGAIDLNNEFFQSTMDWRI